MLNSKQTTLKPLLVSKDGVHLTVYLANRGDLSDLESQLRAAIIEAHEWLSNAMTAEEKTRFLEPLESLLNEARIFTQMRGNIGIFRNEESFRVLSIPIDVEPSCQVATSFHIKPLLRWLQMDQEFLLLGIEKNTIHLYLGSQTSFKLIDSVVLPRFFKTKHFETFSWLSEWIFDFTKKSKPKLFIAGEPSLAQALSQSLKYKNAVRISVADTFSTNDVSDLCRRIRKILKEQSEKSLEKVLMEFRFAENDHRTKKNIFQISKAVVQGKVRKLIVTDELNIFGKIDQRSGGLAIHPCDLDHEDDCILDDLAQMVLSQGGEVVVAKRNEIPKGRPILAILDDEGENLQKIKDVHNEAARARLG